MFTKVDQGKSSLYECIPEVARVYEGKIKSDPAEAKDFLERLIVLPAKPQPATPSFAQKIIVNPHIDKLVNGDR